MRHLICIVAGLVLLAGVLTLQGCSATQAQSANNQNLQSQNDRYNGADQKAAPANAYVGNGAFGETPP